VAAIEILERTTIHAGEPLGHFTEGVLVDIGLDRKTLARRDRPPPSAAMAGTQA
jgi:hypothetical protein